MAGGRTMTAAIWSGAGTASDGLLLAAAIVAALDVLARIMGIDVGRVTLAVALALVALGLLAL